MSEVATNQPEGTPTWVDLGIPDLDRAMDFYRALFGWEYDVGPAGSGRYTTCLLRGRAVAGLAPDPDPAATEFWWNVYLATDDCDATTRRVVDAGGTVVVGPLDVPGRGRTAVLRDPVGAPFGLWEGREHIGAERVNEPGAVVRTDLVTPTPEPARAFYAAVFGFTLDRNEEVPEFDFTFLRRPDGHEVAGVFGLPDAPASRWVTTFEVADTDAVVQRARAAGGSARDIQDMVYGRIATIVDPFGTELSVIARPAGEDSPA
jgi:predicted enzyme related to lactoylglutathione lyase